MGDTGMERNIIQGRNGFRIQIGRKDVKVEERETEVRERIYERERN